MKHRAIKAISLLAPFALLAACGPSWVVVKQSNPNALAGKKVYAVEAVKFDNLMVGKKSEAEYLTGKDQKAVDGFAADKTAMTENFTAQMIKRKGGLDISASTGAAPAGGFTVRPVIYWLEPGSFNAMFNIPTEAKAKLQIVDAQNVVVDEIEIKTAVGADLYHPAVGTRLRAAANQLATISVNYLNTRVGE